MNVEKFAQDPLSNDPRKEYHKPILTTLGKVSTLTTGGTGPPPENTKPELGPPNPNGRP